MQILNWEHNKQFILKVPNLRFANDIWKNIKLSECASGFEYGVGAEAKDFDGIHKYIRITDIDDNYNYFIKNDLKTPSFYEDKYIVKEGDILLARTGASTGKSYLYDSNDGLLYFAGFLIRIHIKNGFDAQFIYQYTKSLKYKNWISIMSARSGQPGINAQEYKRMCLFVPSYINQVKIGKFLTLVDKRIETQSKIISALESQKIAICNQIRTIESNTIEASVIFEFMNKTNHQSGDGNDSGNYIFFTNEEITNKLLDIFDFDGEYIIANTGGKANFKYFNGKFATMSDCLVIKTKFTKFYYYYLQSIKNYVDFVGFEGSGLKHLNKKWLLKLQIPSFNEKHKHIVKTLDLLDCKLEKEKLILEKYKEQKKFLLSNMFI